MEDNFNEWFEHIDHFVRHRIVPVGEEQTTTERRKTPKTHVKYQYVRFSLSRFFRFLSWLPITFAARHQQAELQPGEAGPVGEHDSGGHHLLASPTGRPQVSTYLHSLLRPPCSSLLLVLPLLSLCCFGNSYKKAGEDFHAGEHEQKDEPEGGNDKFYVDAFKLSRVLYHLILSVNLTDSYTLFIMNPKKAVGPDQTYGYRCAPSSGSRPCRASDHWLTHTTSLLCAHWLQRWILRGGDLRTAEGTLVD